MRLSDFFKSLMTIAESQNGNVRVETRNESGSWVNARDVEVVHELTGKTVIRIK